MGHEHEVYDYHPAYPIKGGIVGLHKGKSPWGFYSEDSRARDDDLDRWSDLQDRIKRTPGDVHPLVISGGHLLDGFHRASLALNARKNTFHAYVARSESAQKEGRSQGSRDSATKNFGELAPYEQAAAAKYHEQMIEEGNAEPNTMPRDYRYEMHQEPMKQFIKRYMDADDEFRAEYPHGSADFQAHHDEMLRNHPIPSHSAKNRWPLIVRDTNPNYVDDGYHRMHSYIRDGATSLPTMRMWPKDEALVKQAATVLPHERLFGPTYGLDHRLFEGDVLRPEIRRDIVEKFSGFCSAHDYPNWHDWAKIVFFGSEASTWTSPTLVGNNDFDLSIGVEYERFRAAVPTMRGLAADLIASGLTEQMHAELNDPATYFELADGSRVGPMDQTWFANLLGWDIRQIRPYAAYDVVANHWIVKPPDLPDWDINQFPQGHGLVREIQGIIEMARGILAMPEPYRTQQGAQLWEYVHANRSGAFGPQGEGWWDVRNVVEKALDQKGLIQPLFECHQRAVETPHSLDAPAGWSNDPSTV